MDIRKNTLEDYISIVNKTKKKFTVMKRPNFTEASDSLSRMANSLESQNSLPYAGMVMLSKARFQEAMNNASAEAEATVEAGSLFFRAEQETAALGALSLQNYLAAGMNCYLLAVQLHAKNQNYHICISISLKLACLLKELSHYQDSLSVLQSSLNYYPRDSPSVLPIWQAILDTNIVIKNNDEAMSACLEIKKAIKFLPGPYSELVSKNEVTYVLLVLLLHAENVQYEAELDKLMRNYHPEDILNTQRIPYLDESIFYKLQTLILAYKYKETDVLCQEESELIPYLSSEQQFIFYQLTNKTKL